MITFPGACGTAKPHSSKHKLLPSVPRKSTSPDYQDRREIGNACSWGSSVVTGWTTREGSWSWLNTVPWLSCPWRVLSSPSIKPRVRQDVGGDAANAPSFMWFLSAVEKEEGMLYYSNTSSIITHRAPHPAQLRAESEFQAIGSGTSAASKYWCPPFPKARKHEILLCGFGGAQESWNRVRRFRKSVWSQYQDGKHWTPNSSQWDRTRASKSWVTTPQTLGRTAGRLIPPVSQRACHQNAIFCSRSHWKTRTSRANLNEVTVCRHLQVPCRRDNSALHHSQPGTAPARPNRVGESLC